MNAIETRELTYVYSKNTPFEKTAVDHVNLAIEAGEFVGVIGHTGSGKSTLIQHFNGLLKPTSGQILINGTDLWGEKTNIREYRFKVGLVFQYPEYQLFEETVYKDIAFGPTNMGLSPAQVDERVREAADFVGLRAALLDKSPFELSGGQKRRVATARALLMDPPILIADEPTNDLDAASTRSVADVLFEHVERGGILLFATHDQGLAARADRIMHLDGKTFV